MSAWISVLLWKDCTLYSCFPVSVRSNDIKFVIVCVFIFYPYVYFDVYVFVLWRKKKKKNIYIYIYIYIYMRKLSSERWTVF
jgi:hypothetical protein